MIFLMSFEKGLESTFFNTEIQRFPLGDAPVKKRTLDLTSKCSSGDDFHRMNDLPPLLGGKAALFRA